jgi:UDP-N-acetylmuramoylalanine--D-glutamate ligase
MTPPPRQLTERDPDLRGLRLLVVGLGRSGLAAARLAARRGAQVRVADARGEEALGQAVARAREAGAEVLAGGHPSSLADAADLIVVSPGVPLTIPLLVAARRLGLPVWGEVELAARFCRGRIVAVTGSNGKSTVTSMIGHVLRGAGVPGGTGGNLSVPLADLLAEDGPDAVHAVELSSFQLETAETLRPAVALLLNLSPDHLDRYPSLEAYYGAKARLLELQERDGAALLNADDAASQPYLGAVRGRRLLFSTRRETDAGGFVRRGVLTLRTSSGDEALIESARLPLPGEHNLANYLAAAVACRLVGCAAGVIAARLLDYRALPHRLEHVRTLGGVQFYNDSKATNPASAVRALLAFETGRVHLILGGRDKGADWSELAALVGQRAKRVLLVGEAAPRIERLLPRGIPRVACGSVAAAVRAGLDGAAPGDVVLLSPACASFDQYRNFEQRGDDFRQVVQALDAGRADA